MNNKQFQNSGIKRKKCIKQTDKCSGPFEHIYLNFIQHLFLGVSSECNTFFFVHFSLKRKKKSFYFRYIFLFLKDISILETESNLQYKYCSCSTKIAYDAVMWKPKIQYFISTVFHFLFYFNLHIFVDCILVSIRTLLFLCL